MLWRASIICVLLAITSLAHATDVTTYGMGLASCKDYTNAREEQSVELVGFTDWLSGYLSGVNATSGHRNNFLSHDDLEAALTWLDGFCQDHSSHRIAEATWTLVLGAKTGSAAHAVDAIGYGSGYKSCAVYREARGAADVDLNVDRTEFVAWLGGYLSGINAMSLKTSNAAGVTTLTDALRWLDSYCDAHETNAFGDAVQVWLTARGPDAPHSPLAVAQAATAVGTAPAVTSR
jgi:hypothetical protein